MAFDPGLLARLDDAEERRAAWRRVIVRLSEEDGGPSPLEGLAPDEVVKGVRAALDAGLADDVAFVDAPRAGAALYALASALPPGTPEQRELGRKVFARLLGGDAHTFVAIATSMALAGGKAFASAPVHARIGLVVELPLAHGVHDGALALALVGRRQLGRDWVVGPSRGSLAARRLSARLIERAACEASRRAARGDPFALRWLEAEALRSAAARLHADRESLVWRHAAVARGMVAPFVDGGVERLVQDLSSNLSPTEWRRAATAVGALVGVRPGPGAERARALLASDVLAKDPGVAGALVWGLTRSMEAELDASLELLAEVARDAPVAAAEAFGDLALEWPGVDSVAQIVREVARALDATNDDDAHVLARQIREDLGDCETRPEAVRPIIAGALDAFASQGAQAAIAYARPAVDAASASLDALDLAGAASNAALGRRSLLGELRDLDVAWLRGGALVELARLDDATRGKDTAHLGEALDRSRERLAEWVLAREAASDASVAVAARALRVLVHLVDTDLGDDEAGAAKLRKRWGAVVGALLSRFEGVQPVALRRATTASLARLIDTLVRAGVIDPVDAVLACAAQGADVDRFEVLAEASMDASVRHAMARYATFVTAVASAAGEAIVDALDAWTADMVPDHTVRAETLRKVLHRLGQALRAIVRARSLRDLSSARGTEADVVAAFETAVEQLVRMTRGARARLVPATATAAPQAEDGAAVALAVEIARVLSGTQNNIAEAALEHTRHRARELPTVLGRVCENVISRVADLPADDIEPPQSLGRSTGEADLPAWLPPRRTLGGFYVLGRLGSGGGGSVFVAQRVEDRLDATAERFALKVPNYAMVATGTMSEPEFLQMFRSEASALLTLPEHPNLARFVTFDSGCRPKPILVMELVNGVTLEHVIQARALDAARALAILDDIAAGLGALHAVGVGHLDVKPSNVVLRVAPGEKGRNGQAVLVDFGLAGRHVRPGCASGSYGAPEVWTDVRDAAPSAADVYSFACLAFETLTGRVLFSAVDEVAVIAQHVAHDGLPDALRVASNQPGMAGLVEVLFSMLRRDPSARPSMSEARVSLSRLGRALARQRWPFAEPRAAR